jgi:hypothetical protein
VDFHIKDLVIPSGILFLRWIPRPGAHNSRYSFRKKGILILLIASTFYMLNFSDVSGIEVIFLLAITFLMQISVMCVTLSYFVLLAGTFLMPNFNKVRSNKKSSDR